MDATEGSGQALPDFWIHEEIDLDSDTDMIMEPKEVYFCDSDSEDDSTSDSHINGVTNDLMKPTTIVVKSDNGNILNVGTIAVASHTIKDSDINGASDDDICLLEIKKTEHCSVCKMVMVGYRYICVQCADCELCASCETCDAHAHPYMLRAPADRPYSAIQSVLGKVRRMLEEDGVIMTSPHTVSHNSVQTIDEVVSNPIEIPIADSPLEIYAEPIASFMSPPASPRQNGTAKRNKKQESRKNDLKIATQTFEEQERRRSKLLEAQIPPKSSMAQSSKDQDLAHTSILKDSFKAQDIWDRHKILSDLPTSSLSKRNVCRKSTTKSHDGTILRRKPRKSTLQEPERFRYILDKISTVRDESSKLTCTLNELYSKPAAETLTQPSSLPPESSLANSKVESSKLQTKATTIRSFMPQETQSEATPLKKSFRTESSLKYIVDNSIRENFKMLTNSTIRSSMPQARQSEANPLKQSFITTPENSMTESSLTLKSFMAQSSLSENLVDLTEESSICNPQNVAVNSFVTMAKNPRLAQLLQNPRQPPKIPATKKNIYLSLMDAKMLYGSTQSVKNNIKLFQPAVVGLHRLSKAQIDEATKRRTYDCS